LEKNQVIHLFSRPHTPTDNGRVERGIGEGKSLAGLGKGVVLESAKQGVQMLNQALKSLNKHLPRRSKGGFTAMQLKQRLPHWEETVDRSTFYKAACTAMQAVTGDSKRIVRREKREAIFRTLEGFGLIRRTRGVMKSGYAKEDRVS
ncbi:MAG TPA: hypothetical protein VHQ04_12885, partial [Puia sp.]|nr:hypothetical protein [Puia sp.]